MKIQEIIDKLEAFHPDPGPHTCDCVKIGDPEKECTGLAITCFASADVIQKAADSGANFIICHEPVFYNHEDDTAWLKGDPVYEQKKKLIEDTGMVIYRDHDHIHGGHSGEEYDGIFYGIMNELGWKDYLIGDIKKPLLFEIPETPVKDLANELMEKLNISGIRIVGSQDTMVRRVFMCEHVQAQRPWGNSTIIPDNEAIKKVNEMHIDAMIPFEIIDWTLSAYVRDSTIEGMPKTILEMGHFNVEELGMRFILKYMDRIIGEEAVKEIPMQYIQSGDSFSYLLRK